MTSNTEGDFNPAYKIYYYCMNKIAQLIIKPLRKYDQYLGDKISTKKGNLESIQCDDVLVTLLEQRKIFKKYIIIWSSIFIIVTHLTFVIMDNTSLDNYRSAIVASENYLATKDLTYAQRSSLMDKVRTEIKEHDKEFKVSVGLMIGITGSVLLSLLIVINYNINKEISNRLKKYDYTINDIL